MTALLLTAVLAPRLSAALELKMLQPKKAAIVGAPVDLAVRVTNRSNKTIMVVPEDIGFQDLRSPICHIECCAVGSDKWVDLSQHPTCGNTDPIHRRDFVELMPGRSMDWHGALRWSPDLVALFEKNPGRYEIRFSYRTDSPIDDWVGGPTPEPRHSEIKNEIRSAFDLVPKGVFLSSPAIIDFRASIFERWRNPWAAR